MTISIRRADLTADRELIIDTLLRYLTPLSNARRYDWLYTENPHGHARAWIAVDDETNAIVGMAAAFPRLFYIGDSQETGWVLGDFCIHDKYRSLGPALQLQRACLEDVEAGATFFCYDFPTSTMMAVYKRLSIHPFSRMLRLAKPLRTDRQIRRIVRPALLARAISTAGNLVLAFSDRRGKDCGDIALSLHEGACGEDFSLLAKTTGSRYGMCIQRSAEYLNWRYLENPLYRFELMTARRNGALVGYAFYTQVGQDGTLVDLFGVNDPTVITALADRVVAILRQRGVVTVSAPILESHPWVPWLRRLGFRPRETSPVIFYAPHWSSSGDTGFEAAKWLLMSGDRDS